MLPTQRGYPSAGPSVPGYPSLQQHFNPSQPFPTQNFLPQPASQEQSSLHQGTDPNSPELFKQNLQLVQQNVHRLQDMAKRALEGMQCSSADLATLKQAVQILTEQMRQTGVGGLPLLPVPDENHPTPVLPAEEQLIVQTTRAVQLLYDQLKRGQDSAAVVANLLNSTDRGTVHHRP
ncbi:hypothetical protein C8R46DRAFT_876882 [Mycena filopes]|nr:hypothetical protein C8R46DRAFT_876882 [Mycena filopes]